MWVAVVGRKLEIFTVPLLVPSILGLDKELSWEKCMGPSVEGGSLVLHTRMEKMEEAHVIPREKNHGGVTPRVELSPKKNNRK